MSAGECCTPQPNTTMRGPHVSDLTVGHIRTIMNQAYPPALAESWDKVGLICGDPEEPVCRVALALDCTQEVADRAVELGVDMLIIHHPLLLRGVTSVAADEPKGRVIHTLIRGGVALFAAHTNADSARPGVNDKLASNLFQTSFLRRKYGFTKLHSLNNRQAKSLEKGRK